MYKRALIPLDGSKLAEAVIPFMLEIAGPLDMEIVLLAVVRPIPPQTYEASRHIVIDDADARMREAHEDLRSVAGRLAAKGARVTTRVRYGQPAEEITAAAHAEGADLIAMSTHGRSGLGRLLFGSVAESVLREADVPVFLMRMTESAAVLPPADAAAR